MTNITVLVANCTADFEEGQIVVAGVTKLSAERALLNALKENFEKSDKETRAFYEDDFQLYKRAWHIDENVVALHEAIPRWQTTFADFDYDYVALIEELNLQSEFKSGVWVDDTWTNDTCPKASYSFKSSYGKSDTEHTYVNLFFDYNDPKLSEHVDSRGTDIFKFGLCDEYGDFIKQTDDWEEMKNFVKNKLYKWYEDKYLSGP